MSDFIFNTTGLTAQDREQWEKDNIDKLKETAYNSFTEEEKDRAFKNASFKNRFGNREDYDSLYSMPAAIRDSMYINSYKSKEDLSQELLEASAKNSTSSNLQDTIYDQSDYSQYFNDMDKFKENMQSVEKLFHWKQEQVKGVEDVKNRALEISPYYKKFKDDSKRLPLTDENWLEIAKEYKALVNMTGDTKMADQTLKEYIQNSVQQPLTEKIWNTVAGGGAAIASELITAAGMIYGAVTPEDIIDNKVVDYANDVLETGSLFPELQREAKELGISNTALLKSVDEEKRGWGWNTFGELVQQQGFTTGAALLSFGSSALVSGAFRGAKGLAMMNKTGQALKNTLTVINDIEKVVQIVGVAGFVGTVEGVMEANSAGRDYLEKEYQRINEFEDEDIKNRINEIYSNPELFVEYLNKTGLNTEPIRNILNSSIDGTIPEDLNKAIMTAFYGAIVEENTDRKAESIAMAENEAEKVRHRTALINSVINGALNATFKAGLQAPKVQTAIKRINPFHKFQVTPNGKVKPNVGAISRGALVVKEPISEFGEESIQTITSEGSTNMSYHRMESYLNNKYHGDGQEYLNTSLGEDLKYAANNMDWGNVLKSGIHGALGSMLGSLTPQHRTGPKSRMIDPTTGKKENWFSYTSRRSPITYRNPIWQAIQEQRENYKKDASDAKIIEEWIKNPINKAKYDGIAGTFNWLKELEKAAKEGDEFRYETASLGKLVHDLTVLEKLKGSDYYTALMNDLHRSAEVTSDSPYAQIILSKFKQETGNTANLSDEQILDLVSENAKKMLTTIESINKESKVLQRQFGEALDDDTKETLVWGKIAIDEWKDKHEEIGSELSKALDGIELATDDGYTISPTERTFLVQYGTLDNAKKEKEKLEKAISKAKEQLKKNKKKLDSSQKEKLKARIKEAEKEIENIDSFLENKEERELLLSEREIMRLNAVDRATMLNSANFSRYSQRQQDIIKGLIEKLNAKDINILNNVKKAGQLQESIDSYIKQYNDILIDPTNFNDYVLKARRATARRNMRAQFEDLKKLTNYEDFATAVDDIIRKNPSRETEKLLEETLKNNDLYKKYVKDGNLAEGILNYVLANSKFKDISNDDVRKLIVFSQYLSRKGIDMEDYNAVLEALSETTEDGTSVLTQAINDINTYLPNTSKLSLDNIGELVFNYREALRGFKANQKLVDKVTRPIEQKSSSTTPSKPKDVGKSSFFAGESNTESPQNDVNIAEEESTDYIETVVNNIINTLEEEYEDDNIKQLAISTIKHVEAREGMSEDSTTESFYASLQNDIDNLRKENNDELTATADLLERVLLKVKKEDEKTSREKAKEDLKKQKEDFEKARLEPPSLLRLNPKNPIVKFIERLGGIKYLQDHGNRRTQNPTKATLVRYVYLPELQDSENEGKTITEMVQESLGDNYNESNDAPILAVIEDSNGPISIGDKKYIPIGIMPSSNTNIVTAKIREAALRTPGQLASEGNTLLSSQMIIHSSKIQGVSEEEGDNNISDLIVAQYNEEAETKVSSIKEISNQDKRGILKRILSKFKVYTVKTKRDKIIQSLHYVILTGKGDGSPNKIKVITNYPNELMLTLEDGNKISFTDALRDIIWGNNVEENSKAILNLKRIKSFVEALNTKLQELNNSDGPSFRPNTLLSKDYEDSYEQFISNLNRTFNDFFNFQGTIDIRIDSEGIPNIYLNNSFIGKFTKEEIDNIVYILANLILDDTRESNPKKDVIFQVDYDLFKPGKETNFYRVFGELIEDGILRIGTHTLYRNIDNVTLDIPQQYASLTPKPSPIVTNQENATFDNSEDDVVPTPDGVLVDPDTGHDANGDSPKIPVTSEMEEAERIVKQIKEDSKEWTDPNETRSTFYENKNTGEQRVRVSSLVSTEENIDKFDPNSPYAEPSTGIGNIVDLIARTLAKDSHSEVPFNENFSNDDVIQMANDIANIIRYYQARGWTFVSEGIKVLGTLEWAIELGKSLNYAGTVDLLAYNSRGEFMIIDTKTYRGGIDESTEKGRKKFQKKKAKWARQLKLYAKALSEKYGIKIVDTKILCLGVGYDLGKNEYTTDKNTGTVKVSNSRNKNNIGKPLKVQYLGIQRDVKSKADNPNDKFVDIGFPEWVGETSIDKYNPYMLSEEEQALIKDRKPVVLEEESSQSEGSPEQSSNEELDYGGLDTGRLREDTQHDGEAIITDENPFDALISEDSYEEKSTWESLNSDVKEHLEKRGVTSDDVDLLSPRVQEQIDKCSKV